MSMLSGEMGLDCHSANGYGVNMPKLPATTRTDSHLDLMGSRTHTGKFILLVEHSCLRQFLVAGCACLFFSYP